MVALTLALSLSPYFSSSIPLLRVTSCQSCCRSSAALPAYQSLALKNGFQVKFSLCCDQAIKTPGHRTNITVSISLTHANRMAERVFVFVDRVCGHTVL